jgi:hypothetical protein
MLVVVVLRAESTRLHNELSNLDHQASLLWQQLREEELELARLRNPALIRARAAEMRLGGETDRRGHAAPRPNSP